MVRWDPGARERLQAAALELFAEHGFEQTTAAEIAQAVGLTERTFFRHFPDKREVLFSGQDQLVEAFLQGVRAAPADASPLQVVVTALDAGSAFFPDERRQYSWQRQAVIERNPALQERELLKMAGLATTLRDALRQRGVPDAAATVAGQSAVTVFGTAFAQWIHPDEHRSLGEIETEVLDELVALTGQDAAAAAPPAS